ncbi:MAG: hypothetical protein NT099_08150 [Candidatus Saganbacteria bacterium]|nr:hypothetical protein [Candidatus Saganbacteria bacterium]
MVKFLEARELDPKNAAITKELGILFSKFRSRALAAKEEGKLPEAKTACELARRIRPEDDQILILQRDIERLLTLAEKRAAQEAAAASAPAPASQPKLQNAAAKRAAAAAQKDLERRKEVLARMAREAEAQGKIADAAAALRGLLKIDPDNTVAKQKLAELSARLAAPAPTPAPTPTPIPEPAPAPKTAANTEVHRTRDPSNRKPEKPPLPAAQVAAGRAAAIAYLRTGDHLELSATMVLADDSKAYWRIYNKRLFQGGIKEAREAARKP